MSEPWRSLRIGVTGAAGFVGSHLIRALMEKGARVRALVHHSPLQADVEVIKGDITDTDTLVRFCAGLDGVFHLATALGNRHISENEFMRINARGVSALLEQAGRAEVKRVVHFGSAGIFGRTSGRKLLKEGDPGQPVDAYEKSKHAGEQVALTWAFPPEVCVLRPGWVYGPGDGRTFKLIRRIQSGFFFVAGRGDILQTPIYVDDLVKSALAVYLAGQPGRDYNAAGDPVTVNQLVAAAARALDRNDRFIHVPMGLLLPPAVVLETLCGLIGREAPLSRSRLAFFRRGKPLDSSRIRNELGVDFPTSLETGLATAISGYRDLGWLP